jgi:hypothetical protein
MFFLVFGSIRKRLRNQVLSNIPFLGIFATTVCLKKLNATVNIGHKAKMIIAGSIIFVDGGYHDLPSETGRLSCGVDLNLCIQLVEVDILCCDSLLR